MAVGAKFGAAQNYQMLHAAARVLYQLDAIRTL